MADLDLIRWAYGPPEIGTFGQMMVGEVLVYTVERAWAGNARGISCIPPGEYQCRPRMFYRGGYRAIEVCGVPARSHILFHVANRAREVAGCIAPGFRLGSIRGEWAVLESRAAFAHLMGAWGGHEFTLSIRSGPEIPEAR